MHIEEGIRKNRPPSCPRTAGMQERVGGSGAVVEGGHHKLSQEMECGDFL